MTVFIGIRKVKSAKRFSSNAFLNTLAKFGNKRIKLTKELYDKTHETWDAHPKFVTKQELNPMGSGGQLEFSVELDIENSEKETDRSPHAGPISSGLIWVYLDNGVKEAWAEPDEWFTSKTIPGYIGSEMIPEENHNMLFKGKGIMKRLHRPPKEIEARNWSYMINRFETRMYKRDMKIAAKEAVKAMQAEMRNNKNA